MPRDRRRLDDRRVAHVEARRQRDEPGRRRSELLGHAAVGGDAERPLAVGRAEVVRAAPALLALHAAVERLDDDGGAVLPDAGELVAEDLAAPEADVHEVRRADAGRPHVEQLAGARRFVDVDDVDATLSAPHRFHEHPRPRAGIWGIILPCASGSTDRA